MRNSMEAAPTSLSVLTDLRMRMMTGNEACNQSEIASEILRSCVRRRFFTGIWLVHDPINGSTVDPQDFGGLHLVASHLLKDP